MRFLLAWVILALSVSAANAQTTSRPCYAADGNGSQPCTYVSPTTPMPVTGTFSASIAGFPTTQTTGTPISVTTGGVSGTLPAGAVVVATNVGTTNGAYCKLGASATTSDQYIAPSGGWFAFTVGAATQLTCITGTSTTTVNMVGGSGLPTGTGGGGGVANQSVNISQMGGTAINSGCVGALSGFSTAIPATVCGLFGVYVINTTTLGQQLASASSPVVAPVLTVAGAAVVKGGVPVVNGGSNYLAVAASQTATVLQTSTGATGDYLSHCVIYPATTSPGVVTVFDSTNTAANSAILFAGGSTSLSNLTPIPVPVGAVSVNGAWKVTTGSNVSVVCYGKFS